jgi:hypothetical protein
MGEDVVSTWCSICVVVLGCLAGPGCGGGPGPGWAELQQERADEVASPDQGQGQEDAGEVDEHARWGRVDDARATPMCLGASVCAGPGACGVIADGCGGVIDCGACACVDGEPSAPETTCGACGFGVIVCGEGETGRGACSLPREPELPTPDLSGLACDTDVVFFDPGATGRGDGSRQRPYSRFTSALSAARALPERPVLVAMAAGRVELEREVEVTQGVWMVGGFTRAGERWTLGPEASARTVLEVTGGREDTHGLFANGIHTPTLVSRVRVEVADALGGVAGFDGMPSYGLRALDSPGLVLSQVELYAGSGGAGGAGAPGAPGAPGPDGAPGRPGTNDAFTRTTRRWPTPGHTTRGCVGAVGLTQGGQGGAGGAACLSQAATCDHADPDHDAGLRAQPGRDGAHIEDPGYIGPVASGGTALRTGRHRYTSLAPVRARDGEHGVTPSLSGGPGQRGQGHGVIDSTGRWVPDGAGRPGEHGVNGGGGGGGGGVEYLFYNDLEWFAGPTGGSGGSGGCGGEGGEGGGAGGASIGALIVGAAPTLIALEVVSASGGAGAPGGEGGVGGVGGAGGPGTDELEVYASWGNGALVQLMSSHASGGHGGHGGRGADGGVGGSGAGGASVGVWCVGAGEVDLDATLITTGHGGAHGPQPGLPDQTGPALDQLGCR